MREILNRLFDLLDDLQGKTPSPMASLERSIANARHALRDLHEANRVINRIEEARTEKLLNSERT